MGSTNQKTQTKPRLRITKEVYVVLAIVLFFGVGYLLAAATLNPISADPISSDAATYEYTSSTEAELRTDIATIASELALTSEESAALFTYFSTGGGTGTGSTQALKLPVCRSCGGGLGKCVSGRTCGRISGECKLSPFKCEIKISLRFY